MKIRITLHGLIKAIIGLTIVFLIISFIYFTINSILTIKDTMENYLNELNSIYGIVTESNIFTNENFDTIKNNEIEQNCKIVTLQNNINTIDNDNIFKNNIITKNLNNEIANRINNNNSLQDNIKIKDKEIYEMREQFKKIEKNYKSLEKLGINKEIINKILNSSIIVYGQKGMGSGTLIKKTDKEMYILTCHHIIDDIVNANDPTIKAIISYSKFIYKENKYISAGQIMYSVEIYKDDRELDLTILKVNFIDDKLIVAELATKEPEKGDAIFTIGNPLGIERTVSTGIISNIVDEFYISDGTITLGNSGGGLFNNKGELIGVPEKVLGYMLSPESGMGMSINLRIIKEFVNGVI